MDNHLVVFRQFVDAHNGDNILKFAVSLKHRLDASSAGVMFVANVLRVQNAGVGSQRVNGRINAFSGNGSFQINERVQLSERRSRSWVSRVVSRNVNRLDGRNSAAVG